MGRDVIADIGARISELRKASGMSQAKFADVVGLSAEFVSRLERGLKSPSILTLARIADGLGLELKKLFDIDAPPPTRKQVLAQGVARKLEDAPVDLALKIAAVVDVLIGKKK